MKTMKFKIVGLSPSRVALDAQIAIRKHTDKANRFLELCDIYYSKGDRALAEMYWQAARRQWQIAKNAKAIAAVIRKTHFNA